MDLFVVNRYFGEENRNKESDEKAKLAALFLKVEERRKRKKAVLKVNVVDPNIRDGDTTTSLKEHNTEAPGKTETKGIKKDSEVTSKKKRKRKWKDVADEIENERKTSTADEKKDIEKNDGFTVIGVDKFKKKQKVKRILPNWLSNPSVVSVDLQRLTTTVKCIPDLDKDLIRALRQNNITHFFPVQAQVIPWLLAAHRKPRQYWPHDICVSAPTGSGKTLAFVIPIVQALCHRMVVRVRALVVLPVQDLAVQVHKVFLTYIKHTDLKVALITGQTSFQMEQKQLVNFVDGCNIGAVAGYRSLVDIIVTTPGRLVDHLQSTPGFTLKSLRFLVIDEADRVIDNVQNDWLYHLYNHINTDTKADYHAPALTISNLESTLDPPPQKLLFSATLTQDPEKLQQLGLFQPKLFTSVVGDTETGVDAGEKTRGEFVGKYTTPAELTEYACIVTPESKPLVLHHLVTTNKWKHVLVFVGSRQDAHRLSLLLTHLGEGRLHVAEISSNLTRPAREKILTKFASGDIDMIVSSDALARGMDIEGVDYVILYNAPKSVKNYIHRVGRTGRAGRPGTAVTLLPEKTVNQFNEIIHSAGKDPVKDLVVKESDLEEMEDAYKASLEKLKAELEREAEMQLKTVKRSKKVDPLIQRLRDRKRRLKANKQKKESAIT